MALKSMTSLKSLLSEIGAPDRLTLLERLGVGGQAEVWLARDQMLGRLVTVKQIRALKGYEGDTDDDRLQSLRVRAEMDHPAIPTLFGVIPNGDQSWLVSEYIEGVALSELLGELSPESIYAVAKDLLSTLRCLERLSLVHGDLSPNNIVIDRNGQVRLLDFESCSRIGVGLSSTSTIGFSAPERHARRAGLPTVDIWSVGAILIWLVTQRTPEIVIDDANRPVSVTIGPATPATDTLGDVINIAAAATRLDPGLRPSIFDLEERLALSYRWLEPVNRSALEALVRCRLNRAGEAHERPSSKSSLDDPYPENLSSSLGARDGGSSYHEARWVDDHVGVSRLRGASARPQQNAVRRASNALKSQLLHSEGGVDGKRFRDNQVSRERFFRTNGFRIFIVSLGLVALTSLATAFLDLGQRPYIVRVDTARLSPATTLPGVFTPQWVVSVFSSALPNHWALVSQGEGLQEALLAREKGDSQPGDKALFAGYQLNPTLIGEDAMKTGLPDRGLPQDDLPRKAPPLIDSAANWLFQRAPSDTAPEKPESLDTGLGINAVAQAQNDAVTHVNLNINCVQGICELLAEHSRGEVLALDHTVILDTGDERVWRAAIKKLAQAIVAD